LRVVRRCSALTEGVPVLGRAELLAVVGESPLEAPTPRGQISGHPSGQATRVQIAFPELDVVEVGGLRCLARAIEHLGRHVDPNDPAGRPDHPSSDEATHARAGPAVQHLLTRLDLAEHERIASAGHRVDRFLRQGVDPALVVAEEHRELPAGMEVEASVGISGYGGVLVADGVAERSGVELWAILSLGHRSTSRSSSCAGDSPSRSAPGSRAPLLLLEAGVQPTDAPRVRRACSVRRGPCRSARHGQVGAG